MMICEICCQVIPKPVIIIKTSEGVDIVCSNCWNEFLEGLE